MVERRFKQGREPTEKWRWLKVVGFFHVTCLGWLIFRASGARQISSLLEALASPDFGAQHLDMLIKLIFFAGPLMLFQCYQYKKNELEPWTSWPVALRILFYVLLYLGISLFATKTHLTPEGALRNTTEIGEWIQRKLP